LIDGFVRRPVTAAYPECGGFFHLIRGLYTSAAGALVAQAMIDNVANNLANVSTNGFKRTLLQIEAQPQTQLYRYQTDPGQLPDNRLPGVPTQTPVGTLGSGSDIYATPTIFEQGQISLNGNPLSFALSGPGFFAIQDPTSGQISYTRDGSFMRDANGILSTVDGATVLDPAGHSIPMPALGKIEVDTKGNINVDGAVTAQIGTFEFNNINALQPQGTTQYLAPQNAGVHAATQTSVLQYSDANEKSISTQDDATNQAISTVGKSS
jgi:flagellar basal-body rod protein FlgG